MRKTRKLDAVKGREIYCDNKCGKFLGKIQKGSRLVPTTKHLCDACFSKFKILEESFKEAQKSAKDFLKNANETMPDIFNLFNDK